MKKTKLTFEDLENDIRQENISKAEELWSMGEELPQDLNDPPMQLSKEFKIPDDELAYELFCALPQTFPFRNKEWSKNEFAHHCEKHKINLNDLTLMKSIDAEIRENINKTALEVDDNLFADLLSLKSTPSEEEIVAPKEEEKETQEKEEYFCIDQYHDHLHSLGDKGRIIALEDQMRGQVDRNIELSKDIHRLQKKMEAVLNRLEIIEEENRLLKEINKSLKKEEPLKKSTNTLSDNLTPQEIIASYNTTPKKRRGRPAGYKTSEKTKSKQRAARLNKLNQSKENHAIPSNPQNPKPIPKRNHHMEETTPQQRRNDLPNPQTISKQQTNPRGYPPPSHPQSPKTILKLDTPSNNTN